MRTLVGHYGEGEKCRMRVCMTVPTAKHYFFRYRGDSMFSLIVLIVLTTNYANYIQAGSNWIMTKSRLYLYYLNFSRQSTIVRLVTLVPVVNR